MLGIFDPYRDRFVSNQWVNIRLIQKRFWSDPQSTYLMSILNVFLEFANDIEDLFLAQKRQSNMSTLISINVIKHEVLHFRVILTALIEDVVDLEIHCF